MQKRGPPLKSLIDEWLSDGEIVGKDRRFFWLFRVVSFSRSKNLLAWRVLIFLELQPCIQHVVLKKVKL